LYRDEWSSVVPSGQVTVMLLLRSAAGDAFCAAVRVLPTSL
jgi:hypothetical protein